MNDLDPQAVIVKASVPSETPDDADFGTATVPIEAVVLEAALKVRARSWYPRVGPRRSGKPLPAKAHLAPMATHLSLPLPRWSVEAHVQIALAVTAVATVSTLLAWLLVWWSL